MIQINLSARVVALENLAEDMYSHNYKHIHATYDGGLLRFYHLNQEQGQMYMFFNESVTESSILHLNTDGNTVSCIDLLNQKYHTLPEKHDSICITLAPYQSVILYVGQSQDLPLLTEVEMTPLHTEFVWDIKLYDTVEEKIVKEFKAVTELFNLNKYDVSVNGHLAELQICHPFVFDISEKIKEGENTIEITLCNTLANKIDEKYTAYLPVYAGGMTKSPQVYINI